MATKAERYKAELIQEARNARPKQPEKARRSKRINGPGHNLSARAGRNALVAYEESETKPSRKSTRRSHAHLRAASHLERTQKQKRARPETVARTARSKGVKVRGKRG
jgi:hypothetical protein